MKFYKLEIIYSNTSRTKEIKFSKGEYFDNLNKYFNNPDIFNISAFDKKGNEIYMENSNHLWRKSIYNENKQCIYTEYWNGSYNFPLGEKVYYKYINQLRKQKLKKILRKS